MAKRFSIFTRTIISDLIVFRIQTALKLSMVPLFSFLFFLFLIFFLLKINLIFFEASGYQSLGEIQEIYYDYIINFLSDLFIYFALLLLFNFFIGFYLSELMTRPFAILSNYCHRLTKGEILNYSPDYFTELKLMKDFAGHFFLMLEKVHQGEISGKIDISEQYQKIHAPVFEREFFAQFIFFIAMSTIATGFLIYVYSVGVHDALVELAIKTLNQGDLFNIFLSEQIELIDWIAMGVISLHIMMFIFLAFHLFSKVANPAFAVFSTMRSFLKGGHGARIHLLGYNYLRGYTRLINDYLEYQENRLIKK